MSYSKHESLEDANKRLTQERDSLLNEVSNLTRELKGYRDKERAKWLPAGGMFGKRMYPEDMAHVASLDLNCNK